MDNLTLTYNGNQLTGVSDASADYDFAGSFEYKRANGSQYMYDSNGSLVADKSRGIAYITYDANGNPGKIYFTNGNVTKYVYSATGQKLSVEYRVAAPNVTVPFGTEPDALTQGQTMYAGSKQYLLGGSLVMEDGMVDRFLFDGGYAKAARVSPTTYNFSFYYYNQDHLGNNREVVDSAGTVKQITHYYPFGTPYADPSTILGTSFQPYKYNFSIERGKRKPACSSEREKNRPEVNGKELDRMHGLEWYDYGARMYEPGICRFMTMDPLCEKYYNISPYAYCGNNPVMMVDPDGGKILFVNGYWASGLIGNLIGSDQCGKGYWGTGFDKAAQSFFRDWTPINSTNYIDGSSLFGGDMSGQDRYVAGYFYAKRHLDELTSNMSANEGFNMVTHSEGAAYGAGVAQYLISQGYTVNTILHLSADEGDEFDTPEEPYSIQLSYDRDWVTNNHRMKSTDIYGIIDRGNLKGLYVHGSTKNSSIFKAAEDLLSVKIERTIGEVNGRVYTGERQVAGSTKYNTIFKNVNGHILDINR